MEHLSYGKDELQTTDEVIRDNLETISNVTVAAIDPFNQHDCSADLQMESMTFNADYPMKPERRNSLDGYNENTTKILTEDAIPKSENWEQKCSDQNVLSGKERLKKKLSIAQEAFVSDDRTKETHNVREELKDDIALGIHESSLQADKHSRHDSLSYDYDKFNCNFANNSFVNDDNDKEFNINIADNNNDNIANNILIKARNNDPSAILSPSNKISSDAQYSSLAKQASGFELISHNNDLIATEANDYRDDNGSNFKNTATKEQSAEDSLRKPDDVRKISNRLEAFNKNNEVSSIPMETLRPKIEETEMPTKDAYFKASLSRIHFLTLNSCELFQRPVNFGSRTENDKLNSASFFRRVPINNIQAVFLPNES